MFKEKSCLFPNKYKEVEGGLHQDGGAWGRMEVEVVHNNTSGHRSLQTDSFLLNNLLTWKQQVVVAAGDRRQQSQTPVAAHVAKQLITQVGAHPSSPSLLLRSTPSTTTSSSLLRTEVSPAFIQLWKSGGWKVVNARMEEPGGGRRRRILDKSFYLLTTNCCGKEKFRHQICLNC